MVEPNEHPATASPEQLIAECDIRRLRRSGPGGQHRNKVETAISLHHLPTGVRGGQRAPQPGPIPAQGEPGPGGPATLRPRLRAQFSLAIAVQRRGAEAERHARRFSQPAGRGIGRAGRLGRRSEAGGCGAGLQPVTVGPIAENTSPWLDGHRPSINWMAAASSVLGDSWRSLTTARTVTKLINGPHFVDNPKSPRS